MRATGRTFNDDPITINKSHLFLSSSIALWKLSGSPSPKNTISGFIMPDKQSNNYYPTVKMFKLLILPVLLTHIGQRGILCSNTSGLIVSADTLCPQCVQDAVAKDPSIKLFYRNKINDI